MSEEKHNPGITAELCAAYRKTLANEIKTLQDDINKLDNRLWSVLAGVLITILLTIFSIAVNMI